MTELIEHMKACGWTEEAGIVKNKALGLIFATWPAAIKACIEVASE